MGVSVPGSPKVIVSHATGNTNVAAVVRALYEEQMLEVFYTCLVWRPESRLARLIPGSLRSLFERRSRVQLPDELVRTRPSRELMRHLLYRAGQKEWVKRESSAFSIDGVYRDLDKLAAREMRRHRDARAVYAYEGGALYQFRRAAQLGMRRIYDLPIGYWKVNREISLEEAELQPEWQGTMFSLADSPAKCALKDEEIAGADAIFVASSFTKKTLESYPGWEKGSGKPIHVVAYGTPTPKVTSRALTKRDAPLRVIYVGSLTQRKGISYLAEAMRLAGSAVTLTLIGRKIGTSQALDKFCESHRHIASLSHDKVLDEMSRHDVFVFPSLFEGFGLVIGEALSQGLPVITTPHTGGPDIISEGRQGFIVPIRDSHAIAERLLQLHGDRELLKQMSEAALEQAAALDWAVYRKRTAELVRTEVAG